MDLLFELLERIDTGSNDIIFFADEAGSWQVGIDDEHILPIYFSSLAAVATPEAYAARVEEVIAAHGAYNAATFRKAAREAASAAQNSSGLILGFASRVCRDGHHGLPYSEPDQTNGLRVANAQPYKG